MKYIRLFLGLLLATAVTACSVLQGLPSIPPGWTLTPSIAPTPVASPTPTITPTPFPVARVDVGDKAFFNGDYENALLHYQIAYQDSPDPLIRAAAKWGEARVYFADELYAETIATIQTLIIEYPESVHLGHAYFLQGLANYRLDNFQAAADSWQAYLTLRPGYLEAYTQELRGDALFSAQNYADALPAYSAAIQAAALGDDITLDLKVASTQTELGNFETALALYDGIAARAPNDYIKAQVAYESGLVHQTLGQNDEALGKFRLAVENYPLSYYAYLSLVVLLDAGGEVSELDRGLVDYFAGQYDVAIAAFDRYIAANPGNDGTAYYYRALARRDLNFYNEAIEDLSTFISNYPTHPQWGDAWGEKAFIQWFNLSLYGEGAQTLLDYAAAVPNSEISVEYLMSAARIYERNGQYDKALETWARVANGYPDTVEASTAVFLSGIIYYREGDTLSARDAFNRSLSISVTAEDQARAYLWLGKTNQKLGDNEAAMTAWREGQARDPSGYYSERARDLLIERAPFTSSASVNFSPNLSAERTDADAWIRLTFNLTLDVDLSNLGPLATDERVIRGNELWELGLYEDARLEFESLRLALEQSQDAVGSYRLANHLVDLGLYRPAIFAARQTLTIAGLDEHTESMMAPPYFSHLRYGLYYSDLIIPDAQTNGFDPLLIFSVVRQESLFEGFVSSNAGARGLMQIIPATGEQINFELIWPRNYDENDLYRPDVSVAFGTYYLAKNRDLLNGDMYAALAAYNGGPGNAIAWKELAGDDPDLFLETVRFEETRNYIRNIYEIFVIYRRLYGAVE
ncbi:MAG: tetratricopeptide repeat protein [Anaerolineales bacterium]|nr:tetratricopeptide repeat protein [Anaerolineales bacterium]